MDYYRLARVLKPQGLKGELKLKPYTDDLERFYDLSHIYIKKQGEYILKEVENARTYKQFVYLKLAGVDSCEAAEALRSEFLYIDKASAKKPEGTYFIADLIGMSVVGRNGDQYGDVKEVFNTGAADIYSVAGKKNFMFPAAPGVILSVEENARIITVDSRRLEEVAVYD